MTVDFTHHLSRETLARIANPMKAIRKEVLAKGYNLEDLTILSNGNVHSTLFAISQIDFRIPDIEQPDGIIDNWKSSSSPSRSIGVGFADDSSSLPLRIGLQYGYGTGTSELMGILQGLNMRLHSRVPHNCVTLHSGNADGVTKLFRLLANPGDFLLVEEFSYPGITTSLPALGARWMPIKMDKFGLVPEDMNRILQEWDENAQGRRPHVLYLIPCGQNPTGSTLPLERRKAIYQLAQKWDVLIIEDDPYYNLQFSEFGTISNGHANGHANGHVHAPVAPLPSLLSMDVDGRVIRLDTFSKTVAPGLRLGWYTSHPFFQRHLEWLTDASVQHPNGFSQLYIAELLSESRGWGFDGYIQWCHKLSDDYQKKRDLFLGALKKELGEDWGRLAYAETPVSGMFVRLYVSVEKHPSFKRDENAQGPKTNTREVVDMLFDLILEKGLLVMPGKTFAHPRDEMDEIFDRCDFFRITFSEADDVLYKGASILGDAIKTFFATA